MTIAVRRLKRYRAALRSIEQIAASRHVQEFCVGITGVPTTRRRAYERWCRQNDSNLDGFAILDWDQSPEEIVAFERWLFEATCQHTKYANTGGVKYFPNVNRRFDRQVIYVAWWAPAFCTP